MRKLPLVTSRAAVDIRGVYGQSVLDLYEQMRRLLSQETGNQSVGDFFAEPQVNPVRGEIAWYTDASGPITAFVDLPPDAQQALWQQMEGIRAQIKAVGERYIAGGGHTAGTRADTFRAMLTITDPLRCLFSVGGRPVLSEWGCSLVAGEHRSVDLWTAGAARTPVVQADVPDIDPLDKAAEPPAPVIDTPSPSPHGLPEAPVDLPEPGPSAPKPRPAAVQVPSEPAPQPVDPARSARPGPAPPAMPSTHYDERHERIGIWALMKYLILLLLAFLLIAVLLRGCGAVPIALDDQAANEEKQLRAQIASLREQAGHIAARCTPTGPTP